MLALSALAGAARAEALPLGLWARGDGVADVRIEKCGAALCAVNTAIRDTSGGEAVGHRLVMRVRPDGAGRLTGTADDPQRGRSYAIDIRFGADRMTTRGCILGVLCKSVSWTRIR
ncbi:MAG: DUF2147 domain-containing protein [Methylobacteriaceae bacterium]|nr:DUF2147 domain-containing protein [Methylobacteriaceae bacterium]